MDPQTTMILKNSVLPVKIGNRTFPTIQHYVLSSLLKDQLQQDILMSYPTEKLQYLFNFYDQEQYMRIVYDACNKFHEKKCRSIQQMDKKTVGSIVRTLIKNHNDFLYKTNENVLFPSVIGLTEVEDQLFGYNILGHSLLRIKYLLKNIPSFSDDLMEYIFWKTNPERHEILNIRGKTYKTIIPLKQKRLVQKEEKKEEEVGGYVYDYNDEEEGEENEEGFYPEEVIPIYRDDRVHWIASNANARLDDTRGMGADFFYTTETTPTDPFHLSSEVELYSRTDPLFIFKVYKASEYLVGMMQNGYDIKQFIHKPVDAILFETKISPELLDGSLTSKQRHMIYTEYWNKFMSKSIPYYSFIEKEILYPQNLAGFIRKEYVLDLNEKIGQKIKEILFSSFIYQVIEKSYPHVVPELKIIVMKREMNKFSIEEYEKITTKLYHLFFQKKFFLDEEGVQRIMIHESSRLTQSEIEKALLFVPCKIIIMKPSLEINNTILDPMTKIDVLIDGKLFHDLFQYLYYQLFLYYGGLSSTDAYQLLFHNGEMMDGNNTKLQKQLNDLIQSKKMEYFRQGIVTKYNQYPQVQEILLYSKATNQSIQSTEDETMNLWNELKVDPINLQLMKWVISIIPKDNLHFEKSIYLYFFIHDMMRSMNLVKSLLGRRLQEKSLHTFFQCFYPKLETITSKINVSKSTPKEFVSYINKKNILTETNINGLWKKIYPFIYLFQHEKFVPSKFFQEAKKKHSSITRDDLIHALANIVKCLYQDQDVPNDHFYILTQLISGKDDIPMWTDPSFEIIKEIEEEEGGVHPLLKDINKKFISKKKKKKKPQVELVHYNIIHPFYETKKKLLKEVMGSVSDPVVSRASYALATLERETIHPRRIVFYL